MQYKNCLNRLIENVCFPTLVLDDRNKVILNNSFANPVYNWSGLNLLGKTFFDFFAGEQANLLINACQFAMESKEPYTHPMILLTTNKTFDVIVEMIPIFDIESTSWNLICVFKDKSDGEFDRFSDEAVKSNAVENKMVESSGRTEAGEAKAALRFLLEKGAVELADLKEEMVNNFASQILPFIQALKNYGFNEERRSFLDLMESNARRMLEPFSRSISNSMYRLSPAELKIAGLIRDGKANKEMAKILKVSKSTILTHRHHLRVKLGLRNKKQNLQSHLNFFGHLLS